MLIALTSLSCIKSQIPPPFKGYFINLGFPAQDIGVGSEGDVCVAGLDKLVYCYDMMDDDWVRIVTKDLVEITRLDVNDDGTVYVIDACGVYFLDCENSWVKLPGGGATDIGVGVDFTVWKVGVDAYEIKGKYGHKFTNYGIWKLICDCKCLCDCRRRCMRFRIRELDPCLKVKPVNCYWFRTDGYGINIDVMPNGDAVFTVNHNDKNYATVKTLSHHGEFLRDYLCGTTDFPELAGDITVGNSGVVFVTRKGGNKFQNGLVYKCHQNDKWELLTLQSIASPGCSAGPLYAERISAGPYNQVWFIHNEALNPTGNTPTSRILCRAFKSNKVYTSSRFDYLQNIIKVVIWKPKADEVTPPAAALPTKA